MDRTIVLWDVATGHSVWAIPGIGSSHNRSILFIYCHLMFQFAQEDMSTLWTPAAELITQPHSLISPLASATVRFECGSIESIAVEEIHTKVKLASHTIKLLVAYTLTYWQIGAFLWKGLQGKVSCVRYHPQPPAAMNGVECLAFGTEDGKLGLYDTSSGKLLVLFSHYHKGTVYELDWRLVNRAEGRYLLYSCGGDGVILETDPEAHVRLPFGSILSLF